MAPGPAFVIFSVKQNSPTDINVRIVACSVGFNFWLDMSDLSLLRLVFSLYVWSLIDMFGFCFIHITL